QPGDCISSIAAQFGFHPDTIWNHGPNANLKQSRMDMNVLLPGDIVEIPDLRVKEVSKGDKAAHKFRRKGVPEMLKVQFIENDDPRANEQYRRVIDGVARNGTLDGSGWLKEPIPPGAKLAEITFGENETYPLQLGNLDPVDDVKGVQGRLTNLGFYYGPID